MGFRQKRATMCIRREIQVEWRCISHIRRGTLETAGKSTLTRRGTSTGLIDSRVYIARRRGVQVVAYFLGRGTSKSGGTCQR